MLILPAYRRILLTITVSLAGLALLFLGFHLFDQQDIFLSFIEKVEQAGWQGQLLFMLIVIITVIGLIPSVMLTLGAGLLYGVVPGSFLIVVSETIGATIAFILGRYLFTKKAKSLLQRRIRLEALLAYPGRNNWRFVALTRMTPFLPFKMMNYLYGLTPLTLKNYMKGTFLGLWPVTVFNVYLGSLAGDVLSLRAAGQPQTVTQWVIYLVGFFLIAALLGFSIRRAMLTLGTVQHSNK